MLLPVSPPGSLEWRCLHVPRSHESQAPPPQREGKGGLEARCLCCVQICQIHGCTCCGWKVCPRVMGISQTRGKHRRFCCHCCPISYGCGHGYAWEAGAVCTASPDAVRFSETAGWAAMNGDYRNRLCCAPIPPPLCIPVHSTLDVQMCGILWSPGVLGRVTFVRLGMFYWL